jgi:hypothetical protein
MLKAAHIPGVRIVHPTVDIDEKERAFRLANCIDRGYSL